jgi:ACS family glucarate transporter-like MFS transporter
MKSTSLFAGKRRAIALLLFFNIAINYMDRVNLGVAAPEIASQFHRDAQQMGALLTFPIFFYTLFLLPCGWLADRFGARRILAIAVSVWSAMAMLTGAATNIGNMMAARMGLNAGEASSIPVSNKVIRQWFPKKERAFATAVFHSGIFMTIGFSSPLIAFLVTRTGWRGSFFITGALGFAWLMFWLAWFKRPEECKWLPPSERALILEDRREDRDGAETPSERGTPGIAAAAGHLLRYPAMWGLALALGLNNYMNYVFLTWLPSYLVQARGMNLLRAGIYSGIPYIVGVTLELCFGRLSDFVLTPDRLKHGARRYQVVLFMLLSSVVLLADSAKGIRETVAVLSLALACNTTVIAIIYALTNDLLADPGLAGTAFGILLFGGNLIGQAAPYVTGYLVKTTGSFSTAFLISGVLPLLGAAITLAFARRPIGSAEAAKLAAPQAAAQ